MSYYSLPVPVTCYSVTSSLRPFYCGAGEISPATLEQTSMPLDRAESNRFHARLWEPTARRLRGSRTFDLADEGPDGVVRLDPKDDAEFALPRVLVRHGPDLDDLAVV